MPGGIGSYTDANEVDHLMMYNENKEVVLELLALEDYRLIFLTPTFNKWRLTKLSTVTWSEVADVAYFSANASEFRKTQQEDVTPSYYVKDNVWVEFIGIHPNREIEQEGAEITGREKTRVPFMINFFAWQEAEHFGTAKEIKKEEFDLLWKQAKIFM